VAPLIGVGVDDAVAALAGHLEGSGLAGAGHSGDQDLRHVLRLRVTTQAAAETGSQGLPARAAPTASRVVRPWAAAESR
jgi:hypothetical protein